MPLYLYAVIICHSGNCVGPLRVARHARLLKALKHFWAWLTQQTLVCSCVCVFAGTVQRLESGDLKLRVRALEAERALTRVQAWQRVVASALVASTLVNVGTVLTVSAMTTGATVSFAGAGVFGLLLLGNYLKVVKLEKKEAQLAGAV